MDGLVQAAARLSALWHGRLADVGAGPGGRPGRRVPRLARSGRRRVRGLDLWPTRRRPRATPNRRRPRGGRHRGRAALGGNPAPGNGAAGRRRGAAARSATRHSARHGSTGSGRATPGVRQLDRRLVHHLPGQRADRARPRRGAPRLCRAPGGRAERRLDPAGPEITAFLQQFGRSGVPLYCVQQDRHPDRAAAAAERVERPGGARENLKKPRLSFSVKQRNPCGLPCRCTMLHRDRPWAPAPGKHRRIRDA